MTTGDCLDPGGRSANLGADLEPPVAEKRPHAIVAHGDERRDDWYWLRDRDDPQVRALLEAENAYTRQATAHLEPLAHQIYDEILASTELTSVTYPSPKGEWAYYMRTVESLQLPIWCRRPRSSPPPTADPSVHDPQETVLIDENALAAGHDYLEVGEQALSPDQRLVAYSADTSGSELMTIRLRDLASGDDLPDVIENASYGLAFAAGNETLFYTRPDEAMRPYQVWRHRLGTPASEDAKVLEEKDERFFVTVGKTKDGAFVTVGIESNITSEWLLIPAASPEAEPVVVVPRRHGVLYSIEHHDGELLILSNEEAESFALFRTPLAPGEAAGPGWEVLLPAREDVILTGLDVVSGHALVTTRGHASTAISVLPLDGGPGKGRGPLVLQAPPAGTISLGDNLDFETSSVRYTTTSLIHPKTLYELDLATGQETELWRQPVPGGYDAADYRTAQRWATSGDGAKVAVTISWRADRKDGPGPMVLYGYGAYGISSDPAFRTDRPARPLLDRGVAFALAHVRGGQELGRRWYLDGKLAAKHHSFEDFLAVARHLCTEGWTTPEQLCIQGASAGGLLVGATVNLDPSAFGAVVADVPFVDCLTTMLDTTLPLTTHEWEEWGDPASDEEAYRCIKAYAPYDNVGRARYPRMFVTSALNDMRVGYFEAAKWVQKLRAAHPDNRDRVLLKVEISAGHFGPSGRYDAWRRRALASAFVLDALGVGVALAS